MWRPVEERRQRIDSDPSGSLQEQLRAVAFDAHWYGYPLGGYPSDIASITRTETEEWFRTYYAPNRLTLAVVGDVRAEDVVRLVREYFGDIPRQEPPEPLLVVVLVQIPSLVLAQVQTLVPL